MEKVILVDENDKALGSMEKMEAHRKSKLHRAISVFVIDHEGKWLLQKRAYTKYHSGGLWTNTCCTHPQPGETSLHAANRRLLEEMGIKTGLKEIFHFTYKEVLDNEMTEHEIDHIFLGITNQIPAINKMEVDEWKYISYFDLTTNINKNPENYTVWFRMILERVNEHINQE